MSTDNINETDSFSAETTQEYVDKSFPLAILVAGLEDFSSWLDFLKPEEVSDILNRYFDAIGRPVDFYGGYIDKYLGDGFISVFGLNKHQFGHPAAFAVLASFDILHNIKEFNQFLFKKYGREFSMGIGIDYGQVVLGKIGFRSRKEFTTIGRPVSRAKSIEKLTRSVESSILVSNNAHQPIAPLFHWGEEFRAKLKKENRSIDVVRPISLIQRRYTGGVKMEQY